MALLRIIRSPPCKWVKTEVLETSPHQKWHVLFLADTSLLVATVLLVSLRILKLARIILLRHHRPHNIPLLTIQ